ncbi:hypothetical protein FRB93_007089 [Tulasnella sp. JGI-2019a]|nr:hypothetical protein FRB93_007089 [Tulasnella sp. JGI-2019a]
MQFLSFSGREDEDVTLFLQNVTRIAFTKGNARDNDWHADYVGTCLSGGALDWYAELDEEVQRSWRDIRLALLKQFSVRGRAPDPPPAAAPPPPNRGTPATPRSPLHPNSSTPGPSPNTTTPPTRQLQFEIPGGAGLFGPITVAPSPPNSTPYSTTHNAVGRRGGGTNVSNDGRTGEVYSPFDRFQAAYPHPYAPKERTTISEAPVPNPFNMTSNSTARNVGGRGGGTSVNNDGRTGEEFMPGLAYLEYLGRKKENEK